MSRIRYLTWVLLLSCIALFSTNICLAQTTADDTASVMIVNRSDGAVCYVMISPSSAAEWGEDWLGRRIIAPGTEYVLETEAGQYDILLADCQANVLEEVYGVWLTDLYMLVITSDSIRDVAETVYPYLPTPQHGRLESSASWQEPSSESPSTQSGSEPELQALIDKLNIRSGPGTTFPVTAQASVGDMFTVSGRNSDTTWFQICCVNGQKGWVINNTEYVYVATEESRIAEVDPPRSCSISAHPDFQSMSAAGGDTDIICPTANPSQSTLAFQPFESGFMIWRPTSSGGTIYVLRSDGHWMSYPDKWSEAVGETTNNYRAPAGLLAPKRGFGFVWADELGGPTANIGWATANEVGSDNGLVQTFEEGGIGLTYPGQPPVFLHGGGQWMR